jgi:replicative DNA helicase
VQCFLATWAEINFSDTLDPQFLKMGEIEKLAVAASEFGALPIDIIDVAGIDLGELEAQCKWRIANGAGLILVDYLQLVRVRGMKERYDRVTAVSASLRDLPKMKPWLCPIIALSQLSRPEKGRENQEPTLYDLKESGNIENDAVQVWLIYRPQQRDEVTDRKVWTGVDWIIVGKNRFGPQGHVPVRYNGPHLKFVPREVISTLLEAVTTPATPAPDVTQGHFAEWEQGNDND